MKPLAQILMVEPSDIIRAGLKSLLDEDEFVFQAPLREVPVDMPQRLMRQQPDILLLNPTLLNPSARMQLVSLQQARPCMAIVALVYQYVDPQVLSLFRTVLDIREGSSRVAQLLRESCQSDADSGEENYELSERESEVLVLVARGLSSKEIADQLNISIHTVNSHRKNITHKTGIKSVAGLAVYAMLHNLVTG